MIFYCSNCIKKLIIIIFKSVIIPSSVINDMNSELSQRIKKRLVTRARSVSLSGDLENIYKNLSYELFALDQSVFPCIFFPGVVSTSDGTLGRYCYFIKFADNPGSFSIQIKAVSDDEYNLLIIPCHGITFQPLLVSHISTKYVDRDNMIDQVYRMVKEYANFPDPNQDVVRTQLISKYNEVITDDMMRDNKTHIEALLDGLKQHSCDFFPGIYQEQTHTPKIPCVFLNLCQEKSKDNDKCVVIVYNRTIKGQMWSIYACYSASYQRITYRCGTGIQVMHSNNFATELYTKSVCYLAQNEMIYT